MYYKLTRRRVMDKFHIKNIVFSKNSRKLIAIRSTIMEVTQFQENWWIIHALKVVTAFVDGESDLLPSLTGSLTPLLLRLHFYLSSKVIRLNSSKWYSRGTHEEKTSAFKQPQEFQKLLHRPQLKSWLDFRVSTQVDRLSSLLRQLEIL